MTTIASRQPGLWMTPADAWAEMDEGNHGFGFEKKMGGGVPQNIPKQVGFQLSTLQVGDLWDTHDIPSSYEVI